MILWIWPWYVTVTKLLGALHSTFIPTYSVSNNPKMNPGINKWELAKKFPDCLENEDALPIV